MIRQPDYDRAATCACRALVRAGVRTLPVRPRALLAGMENVAPLTYDQAAEALQMKPRDFDRRAGDADAFTFREGGAKGARYVVCYRSGGNPARLNFTLAHELGHIALGHAALTAAEEAEADCFAEHLLCPPPVLAQLTSPEAVSRTCFVSLSAARMIFLRRRGQVDSIIEREIDALLADCLRTIPDEKCGNVRMLSNDPEECVNFHSSISKVAKKY